MDGKKLKIITFDVKQENWNMWSRKFKRKLTIQFSRYLLENRNEDFKEYNWYKDYEENNSIEYSDILMEFDSMKMKRSEYP